MTNPTAWKILLPVDGSADSMAAVRHALRWAEGAPQAAFVLANVQEAASLYEVVVAHDAERIAAIKREAGADLIGPAEVLLDNAGASYESEVAAGTPEHLIVELAENYGCNAIVMGARGQSAAPGDGGLGSVALAVLDASPVPVTVVRDVSAEAAEGEEPEQADEAGPAAQAGDPARG
ncbi:MAG: universal stress protein [Betaproteobacteria bacterium]|nr:universal stress protein [Betaproteobacteria bacterium]MCC6246543.1 universal stress protein [Rubrivivax sp.]MCL4699741.1 universal stress protein [Burkholderiaceae bacterium]